MGCSYQHHPPVTELVRRTYLFCQTVSALSSHLCPSAQECASIDDLPAIRNEFLGSLSQTYVYCITA